MRKKAVFVLVLAVALGGCAGKMDSQRGLSEEWRLRSLEENFLNFKESQRDQEERGRDTQRKLLDRMRAVEDSLARMQEQLGAAPQRKAEPLASAPVLKPSSPALASPAPASTEASAKMSEHAETMAETSSMSQTESMQEQRAMSPAPAMQSDGGKGLYEQGLNLVRAEKSEEGRKVLSGFLEADPGSALVPNAIYWIGESYFQEKNYPQAILTFKDVSRRFPKHHKSAAALLKIGMAYAMMGEKDNATLYLRALLRDYPKSEPAPAARKKLAELGG